MDLKELENLKYDKIFLDIDGCVFHSCQAICDILNKKFNMNVKGNEIISWNFKCCYPKMTDEEAERIFSIDDFFDNVKFIEGSKEFILKHKDKIILLTKGTERNLKNKRQFLDLNGLEDIYMIGLPINISKDIINMKNSIFIDDSTKNLNEVTTAKYKIQFCEYNDNIDREWQIGWNGNKLYKWY